MVESVGSVGLLQEGDGTEEQRAALAHLRERGGEADPLPFSSLAGDGTGGGRPVGRRSTDRFDVLWWHRNRPIDGSNPLADAAAAVDAFLADGGGLLLTGAAMAGVDALGVETVPPDVVTNDGAAEPTGLLWRSMHDDHPIPSAFDSLRIPVREHGAPTVARYENILPSRGEILASTVCGEQDVPAEMRVVSWNDGAGAVLGVGAGLAFDGPAAGAFADNRNAVLAGCLGALAGGYEHPGRPWEAVDLSAMRAGLAEDPHRPSYHLTPPANWLNDPNGLIKHDGRYHVFYQYNPGGPFHNTMHWGHAVSDDLLTWADEPVALSPSPDSPDRDGCWSGCAVDDGGTPTILYTGGNGREQLPCLATADGAHLCGWTKHNENPVITEPPDGVELLETEQWAAEFRDHTVWREDGIWHQLIGSGVADRGGAVLLYTSEDLRDWRYEGPLLIGDWEGAGAIWECPELLDLGGRQLLHVSDYESVQYFLGERRNGGFDIERQGVLDHGDFYAPQSMRDGDRWLTWGWLPEARDVSAQWDAGWSGALSVPREISLGDDGRIRQRPAAELREFREAALGLPASLTLDGGQRERLDASGRTLELEFEVHLADAEAFELSVLESPDRAEYTPITYTRGGELTVDRSPASADKQVFAETQRMHVTPYDEPLSLRVLLDGSVVELYANQRHCLTSRVYPTDPASTGLSLAAQAGRATVTSLSGWRLGNAFDGRGPDRACLVRS